MPRLVFHLRRRLAPEEELLTGPAIDIRADRKAVWWRLKKVRKFLPVNYVEE